MNNMKRWFTALSLTALVLPLNAIAATPEQSLDKAVKAMETTSSYKLDMEMKIDIGERVIGKPGNSMSGQIAIKLGTRILDKQNGEGSFSLERFSMKGVESGNEMSFTLDQPMAIEYRMTNSMFYFRLLQVPSTVTDFLKSNLEIDLTPIIGTWIGIESKNGVTDLQNLPIIPTQAISAGFPQNITAQAAIRKLPIFRVIGIEKNMKNNAGDDVTRLRVRINPSLISAVRFAEIKALPRDKNYSKSLTALNKRYAELRSNLAHLFMAVNLNVTKGRVERMEVGGTIDEPVETCTYSIGLKRNICKTASIRSYKISMGISLSPASPEPILVPFMWKTMEEIQKLLMPPTPTTTIEDPLMQTLTTI